MLTLLIILFFALVLAFEILMFVDVIKNKNIADNRRTLWIIGMLLVHPVVAIAYYFTDRNIS